jgi:hypothetical protein
MDPAPRTPGLKELEALELSLPAVEVQRLILKALVNIEAKAALLQDQNRVLHGMIHSLFDQFFIFGGGTPRPLGDFAAYRPLPPAAAIPEAPGAGAGETAETPEGTPFRGLCLYPQGDLHPLFITALVKNPEFLNYAETCGEGGTGKRRVKGERLMAFELSCPMESGGRRNRRGDGPWAEFNRFARSAEKKLARNQEELRVLQELRRALTLP